MIQQIAQRPDLWIGNEIDLVSPRNPALYELRRFTNRHIEGRIVQHDSSFYSNFYDAAEAYAAYLPPGSSGGGEFAEIYRHARSAPALNILDIGLVAIKPRACS